MCSGTSPVPNSAHRQAPMLDDSEGVKFASQGAVIESMIARQHRSGFDMREKALAAIDAQMESLKRKREIILAEMNQGINNGIPYAV